jgi:hypothetical protein
MKVNLLFALTAIVLLVSQGCSKATEVTPDNPKDTTTVKPPPPVTIPSAGYDLSLLDKATLFETTPVVTVLANQTQKELSGLVPSRRNANVLYTHEDSGNGAEIFITNPKGEDLGKIVLDGINNRDWEDIETGPGPEAGKNYIYMAEIGDNDAAYGSVFIYRFEEPELTGVNAQTIKHVTPDVIKLVYPGGAVNAETLMLDPLTKDLYIATKQAGRSTLYVARYPQSTTSTTTLTALATFPFDLLTSGDISADGSEILLRNTGQLWYWKRQSGESVVDAMLRKPMDAPYAQNEHQGESVCFSASANGYYTVSETKKFPADQVAISFYKRK